MGKPQQKHEFQAEVSRVLDIVTNSLYSHRDVFLRELISNASDACDKRRYEALQNDAAALDNDAYKIELHVNEADKTLTVRDVGIGMDREDMIDNLGTIAKSGTAAFAKALQDNQNTSNDSLIGQFGVGFYASFMVADKVEVISRKVGAKNAYRWVSDGRSGYEIEEATREAFGTDVILHLKEDALDFLKEVTLSKIVMRYSDHIEFPIVFIKPDGTQERLNEGTALWAKPKNDISDQQYEEFYRHIGAGFDSPAKVIHWRVEGMMDYTGLLFIPSMRPYDLFDPKRPHGVRLYVKKVFISEQCEGLVPSWLRFLRGIIDSRDLPLNISRETLQANPVIAKIANGITKKILGELDDFKKNDEALYLSFWKNFGPVLKEGLYEGGPHREKILDLCLFSTTYEDGHTTLDDYVSRMVDGQKEIYYLQGDDVEAMQKSPQLEAFLDQGVEVLLFEDVIDNFWITMMPHYKDYAFKSITKDEIELPQGDKKSQEEQEDTGASKDDDVLQKLCESMQAILGEKVGDVRLSKRLRQSASCLVAAKGDADLNLEKVMKANQQASISGKRILEINPDHPMVGKLADQIANQDLFSMGAHFLYDQACLAEGELPEDIAGFNQRLNALLLKLAG